MSKRLTIKFVKEQFEKEGYMLLTKEYINNVQQLDYICPKGHARKTTWCSWHQGGRCKQCAIDKLSHTLEFVKEQFLLDGYILLTKVYKNSLQPLEYICPKGHSGTITWSNWFSGCRCLECSGKKKLTIEFIKKEFEKENCILLTKKYMGAKQKLEYVCANGHVITTTWDYWRRGNRCRLCYCESLIGEGHPRWNQSLTYKDRKIGRKYFKYYKWAKEIRERDMFTCQVCGQTGGNLVSHHLYSYKDNLNLRLKLDNGVCLCENCHKEFHHKYGWGKNIKEQFDAFVVFKNK